LICPAKQVMRKRSFLKHSSESLTEDCEKLGGGKNLRPRPNNDWRFLGGQVWILCKCNSMIYFKVYLNSSMRLLYASKLVMPGL